jgi:hypothetical protein
MVSVTNLGCQQSGDLRHLVAGGHKRRRRLENGRSSSKDMSRTMTTDCRIVALFRKGSRRVVCAASEKTAYCTTFLVTALLGCSGVLSRHFARLYGYL